MARPLPQPARIFEVGGAVRDGLLGRPTADRDYVVVGVTPETMLASGFRPVGRDFPVFLHPETNDEYALARTERKHGRGYRGFEFFASPDVTLEEDLGRRDLTINAMARGDDGVLIDPHGGQADLRAGVLRHVSAAFVEDPLRVLRVARFAARLGFVVAPETEAMLRTIVDSGELATLAPERVWQELGKGLSESRPSRLLAVLRQCGALAQLLPEVDALFGVPLALAQHRAIDAGVHVAQSLDWSAGRDSALATRYGILASSTGLGIAKRQAWPLTRSAAGSNLRLAERISERLKVPLPCRDAAMLAARCRSRVHREATLPPAAILDLLNATDALRRPGRLDTVLDICAADICSLPGAAQLYPQAELLREALAVVKAVDAGDIARKVGRGRTAAKNAKADDAAIAEAVRTARLRALRAWRRTRAAS